MNNIILSTDTSSDLTKEIVSKNNINIIKFEYFVNGNSYKNDNDLSSTEFYNNMEKGADVKTSQINYFDAKEYLENLFKTGNDILHICFSSGLSGTYDNFAKAAEELNEKYTNKCVVVDSLCAAGGEGLLVLLAKEKLKNEEISLEDLAIYIEEIKLKLNHIFTVNDLKYLVKGGRVSKTSAFIANFLRIKPTLYVDNLGKLAVSGKVFGRKMAINKLFQTMKKNYDKNYTEVLISHANCKEDAHTLAGMIKEEFNVNAKILPLSFVIGCHSGPGTLAVFYIGNKR
ncbi:MAG: DegV family protein [Clostridia bacterium]|nr:DegV family protein [Clostridia bacterium]